MFARSTFSPAPLTLANGLVVRVAFMTVGFFPLQTSGTRASVVSQSRALRTSIP